MVVREENKLRLRHLWAGLRLRLPSWAHQDEMQVDPSQKRFNFAPSLQRSRAALAAELAKCVVVCSNCHDEIEAGFASVPSALAERVRRATAHIPPVVRRRPGRPTTDPPE
jgi:hypothetical protein